ncbi:hypothetical protein CRE_30750 [Caenorhabditis remanei]|uniref:UPAR/Ly6 domain-containing protein n=1 Tax=Caenorhabditis remanei TaxID=31234 RepID=E3LU30_CAERE|nr:hypothetical protein CRE_30750 [Caenorhabditis remanei]
MNSTSLFLILTYLCSFLNTSFAVTCYRENSLLSNKTCEGDFCVAIRTGPWVTLRVIRWDDEMTCYCNTDFCNNDKIFFSNFTSLPIIECKQVHRRKYMLVSCNNCIRIISYVKNRIGPSNSDDEELVQCSINGESSEFVGDTTSLREEMIARNFFVDACYNISMHKEHFYVYCRCAKTDCNSPEVPIPYPLSKPTVTCYTSGFDASIYPKKYEKPDTYFQDNYRMLMANDSYVDVESNLFISKYQTFFVSLSGTCKGDYCFIATVTADTEENEMDVYYKGCISANEHGNYSIPLGYMYLNEIPYYICNTDYCNLNRDTALAKNATVKVVRSIEKVDEKYSEKRSILFLLCITLFIFMF